MKRLIGTGLVFVAVAALLFAFGTQAAEGPSHCLEIQDCNARRECALEWLAAQGNIFDVAQHQIEAVQSILDSCSTGGGGTNPINWCPDAQEGPCAVGDDCGATCYCNSTGTCVPRAD